MDELEIETYLDVGRHPIAVLTLVRGPVQVSVLGCENPRLQEKQLHLIGWLTHLHVDTNGPNPHADIMKANNKLLEYGVVASLYAMGETVMGNPDAPWWMGTMCAVEVDDPRKALTLPGFMAAMYLCGIPVETEDVAS